MEGMVQADFNEYLLHDRRRRQVLTDIGTNPHGVILLLLFIKTANGLLTRWQNNVILTGSHANFLPILHILPISAFYRACNMLTKYLHHVGQKKKVKSLEREMWLDCMKYGANVLSFVNQLAPMFSRQSVNSWRWGYQPYAPAAFYPQKDSWYSFLLEDKSTPGP
jgi:hypothetical protein